MDERFEKALELKKFSNIFLNNPILFAQIEFTIIKMYKLCRYFFVTYTERTEFVDLIVRRLSICPDVGDFALSCGTRCPLLGGTASWKASGGLQRRARTQQLAKSSSRRSVLIAAPTAFYYIVILVTPLSRTGTGSSHFKNLRTGRSAPTANQILRNSLLLRNRHHRSSATQGDETHLVFAFARVPCVSLIMHWANFIFALRRWIWLLQLNNNTLHTCLKVCFPPKSVSSLNKKLQITINKKLWSREVQ